MSFIRYICNRSKHGSPLKLNLQRLNNDHRVHLGRLVIELCSFIKKRESSFIFSFKLGLIFCNITLRVLHMLAVLYQSNYL